MLENSMNDQWRETFILASGFADKKQVDLLITGILEKGKKFTDRQIYLDLLAISCLETAKTISPSVRVKVEERMGSLIPPRNVDAVKSLSAAGNLVVPLLDYQPSFSEDECLLSIDILTSVGSLEALNKINSYLQNPKRSVVNYVEAALAYFTDEQLLLSSVPETLISYIDRYINLKSNSIRIPGQLSRCLLQIQYGKIENMNLGLIDNAELVDMSTSTLAILNFLPSIIKLTLKGSSTPKLENIPVNEKLQILDIRSPINEWASFSKVSIHFPNLRTVKIFYFMKDDWPHYDYFGAISRLELFSKSESDTFDFDSVAKISTLETLHLASPIELDLEGIDKLKQIKHLILSSEADIVSDYLFKWQLPFMDNLRSVTFNFHSIPEGFRTLVQKSKVFLNKDCKIYIHEGWNVRKW